MLNRSGGVVLVVVVVLLVDVLLVELLVVSDEGARDGSKLKPYL